jgi:dGTPase
VNSPLYRNEDYGREAVEPTRYPEPYRSDWRIDHARLIHSPAFRRLQGKTQLFPGESDFFRNRLTHSLEVAQIAKSIAVRLNHTHFGDVDPSQQISPDLVEFAALAHDLGHPPFGHNGEAALDECMCGHGGFEGNAQTLRILSRLEKKITDGFPPGAPVEFKDGKDLRRGLNLTYRSLASILKYDHQIEHRPKKAPLQKGYYSQEAELVRKIKLAVAGDADCESFKTVECKIMDIADDIAYSTYDFEDALKAGFTSLLDILGMGLQPRLLRRVALKVWKRLNGRIDLFDENNIPAEVLPKIKDMEESVGETLVELTLGVLPTALPGSGRRRDVVMAAQAFLNANAIAKNGYLRTSLTSQLVGKFIRGVEFQYVPECPPLSKVFLSPKIHQQIEILKIYNYEAHIDTARLKTVEFRGKEFVIEIFNCLKNDQKNKLLPEDFRARCEAIGDENHRLRTICDFVAGMTDKYALEFYNRLKSGESTTIFKDF